MRSLVRAPFAFLLVFAAVLIGGSSAVSAHSCPLTQGYWKNHPVAVLPLTIGGVAYTPAQLIAILQTPPRGDATLILAHQLIATEENVAHGSIDFGALDAQVAAAIAAANTLLAAHPLGSGLDPSSAVGQQAVTLASFLDQFNSGALTPACI
jgi:hypothetical protein